MAEYVFEGLSDQDLLAMLREVEAGEELSPGDEDFCQAVRQKLKERWMAKEEEG